MATFCIEAVENTTIALKKTGSPTVGTVKYGIDSPLPSTTYTFGRNISLSAGQKCYWTISSTTVAFSSSMYISFSSTGKIKVGGLLSDLIGGESAIPRDYCFYRLFYRCDKLVDASNLTLVGDLGGKTYCYAQMFYSCAALKSTPSMPAPTLTNYCYYEAFRGCTALSNVSPINATIVSDYCCSGMFYGCISIRSIPSLPAPTLATSCYYQMFSGCSSLMLSATQTGKYQTPYRIPTSGTGTTATYSLYRMFNDTGGTFTGTPEINVTYYIRDPMAQLTVTYNGTDIISEEVEAPVSVTYKGAQLTAVDSGETKTLTCNGEWMEADLVVGDKTLNCAGTLMASDVTLTVT